MSTTRLDRDENPIWTALLGDLGPLYDPVDTEWTVLQSQAVMALAERASA